MKYIYTLWCVLFYAGNNASFDDVVLSRDEVARLLFPLLKLRQACCHPQVGSSGLCSLQSSPLTMDEILEVKSLSLHPLPNFAYSNYPHSHGFLRSKNFWCRY